MGSLVFEFLFIYLSPLLFVVGLIYFVYGFIEYFVVGLGGDEERAQNGRNAFLSSITWFSVALIIYGIISLLGWMTGFSNDQNGGETEGEVEVRPKGDGLIDIERDQDILPVPDVPQR